MTIAEYKDWLEDQIKVLGTELESLVIARKVLLSAESFLDSPTADRRPLRKPNRSGPIDWKGAAEIRNRIVEVVQEANQPLKSKEILIQVCGDNPTGVQQKRVWNQIYNLASRGKIQKLGPATYGRGVNG